MIPLRRLRNRTSALVHWARGLFGVKAHAHAPDNRKALLPGVPERIRARRARTFDELDQLECEVIDLRGLLGGGRR